MLVMLGQEESNVKQNTMEEVINYFDNLYFIDAAISYGHNDTIHTVT